MMKKCLVVALSCLVSCAARADMVVDITVERADQPAVTQTYAMNEVARFDEAGITAELVAVEQDGAVCITAKCSRVKDDGETVCGEIPSLTLAFNEMVTLVSTQEVKVTIVARTTDAKTAVCTEQTACAPETDCTEKTVCAEEDTAVAADAAKTPGTTFEVITIEQIVTETAE